MTSNNLLISKNNWKVLLIVIYYLRLTHILKSITSTNNNKNYL